MSSEAKNTTTTSSQPGQKEDNSGDYTMVVVYSVLIVLLIIVLIWSSMSDEKFLGKSTRSDPQKDWDIISELARLNQLQESILRQHMQRTHQR